MEMHQVRYFLAVVRTGNFTRAAEDCHVSQPSLTRAIKTLEGELGNDLFYRERPGVVLTDEISFNSSFMLELGAIAFVEEILKSGASKARKLPFIHGIRDSALAGFGASSKMNNDPAFLHHLRKIGWQAADHWLSTDGKDVGNRSTVDLSHLIPMKDSVPHLLAA